MGKKSWGKEGERRVTRKEKEEARVRWGGTAAGNGSRELRGPGDVEKKLPGERGRQAKRKEVLPESAHADFRMASRVVMMRRTASQESTRTSRKREKDGELSLGR